MSTDKLPGYDVPRVEAWISENVEGLTPPFKWTRLEGGHSNLTCRLDDSHGKTAVIRRPPEGQLLPKAHDMSREWSLIFGLQNTDVPVPEAYGFCEDPEITGAWFYVMGWREGHAMYSQADVEKWVPEELRLTMCHSFIDVLAALHSVDPDEVGLGDLGKRDSYVGRQLKTWYRSWTSSVEKAEYDDPRVHEMREYMLAHLPEQGPARIVHGDYSLHNVLVGADGHLSAVLDWEISTLGDPLADLAYAINGFRDAGSSIPARKTVTSMPGFPTKGEMAERYAEKTGADISRIDYYYGFNHWKSAAILHGVYARYRAGNKSSEGVDLEQMKENIARRTQQAEEVFARL